MGRTAWAELAAHNLIRYDIETPVLRAMVERLPPLDRHGFAFTTDSNLAELAAIHAGSASACVNPPSRSATTPGARSSAIALQLPLWIVMHEDLSPAPASAPCSTPWLTRWAAWPSNVPREASAPVCTIALLRWTARHRGRPSCRRSCPLSRFPTSDAHSSPRYGAFGVSLPFTTVAIGEFCVSPPRRDKIGRSAHDSSSFVRRRSPDRHRIGVQQRYRTNGRLDRNGAGRGRCRRIGRTVDQCSTPQPC